MILLRTFARIDRDADPAGYMQAWQERMEGLLFSDDREVVEFMHDALMALAARRPGDPLETVEKLLGVLREVVPGEGVRDTVEHLRTRHRDVLASVAEQTGLSRQEAELVLARRMRLRPWELPSCSCPAPYGTGGRFAHLSRCAVSASSALAKSPHSVDPSHAVS